MNPNPSLPPPLRQTYGSSYDSPKPTGLAIASMILGIVGLIGACCLGGVLGLIGAIMGHVAMGKIARSGGLASGRGMAIAGIITGYLSVVVTGIALTLFFTLKTESGLTPAQEAFGGGELTRSSAFNELGGSDPGDNLGNSDEAIALAEKFREALLDAQPDDEYEGVSIYCRLSSSKDRCAFIVENIDFKGSASDLKAIRHFWDAAIDATAGELPDGTPIAVGSSGLIFFQGYALGRLSPDADPIQTIDRNGSESALNWFFTDRPLEDYPLWKEKE